ncbi:alpha/beta hydrolase [Novosphingobium sp. ZN18A2]|uniref:alpha/beta fold hydrolase n=1 Tax=Novosphingobium sp. ZN18A2 TaxID=3079861 RepID=UPI0030D2A756
MPETEERNWVDRHWTTRDGLNLHFREYPGPAWRPPVLCLPGLTRNARDFEDLAARLSPDWRVLCLEMRGRGDSDYARDPMSYNPLQYIEDIEELMHQQQIARFVSIGTSLGGLLTMMLAGRNPDRIVAAVLNDIGPEVDPEGIARIRGYVGQGRNYETWMHAARGLQESQGDAYPGYGISDWLRFAKRVMALGTGGRISFDYDMKIAEPFERDDGTQAVDMWPLWRALAGRPVLLLRGELSDILPAAVARRMVESIPDAELVTIPATGHAPTFDEPEAIDAVERLLARIR